MIKAAQHTDIKVTIHSDVAIDLPVANVYDAACNYPFFEKRARAKDFTVKRHGTRDDVLTDISWTVSGIVGSKFRQFELGVTKADPPHHLTAACYTKGIVAIIDLHFSAVTAGTTSLKGTVGLIPSSFLGHLTIHALRLSRPRLTKDLTKALTRLGRIAARRSERTA